MQEYKVYTCRITRLERNSYKQLDDLEQYSRKTNTRNYGIPESNVESTDTREDTDVLSLNFVLKPKDISRSHRIIVILCLVPFHAPLAN